MLAPLTDAAAITGTLFYNVTLADGSQIQQPIPDQTISLHRDSGNGIWDDAATDPELDTAVTDEAGRYRFDSLTVGTYFVVQPPSRAARSPADLIVPTVVVKPVDVEGVEGRHIDLFDDGELRLEADSTGSTTQSGSVAATLSSGRLSRNER